MLSSQNPDTIARKDFIVMAQQTAGYHEIGAGDSLNWNGGHLNGWQPHENIYQFSVGPTVSSISESRPFSYRMWIEQPMLSWPCFLQISWSPNLHIFMHVGNHTRNSFNDNYSTSLNHMWVRHNWRHQPKVASKEWGNIELYQCFMFEVEFKNNSIHRNEIFVHS